jgi:hypothetical protein
VKVSCNLVKWLQRNSPLKLGGHFGVLARCANWLVARTDTVMDHDAQVPGKRCSGCSWGETTSTPGNLDILTIWLILRAVLNLTRARYSFCTRREAVRCSKSSAKEANQSKNSGLRTELDLNWDNLELLGLAPSTEHHDIPMLIQR